jgi:hypothetical protein
VASSAITSGCCAQSSHMQCLGAQPA